MPCLCFWRGSRMPTIEAVGRRAFLTGSTLLLATGVHLLAGEDSGKEGVKFGLITDLHYADKPATGSRYYRETLGKLAEVATQFEKEKLSFLVELGDLVDAADSVETEQTYLKRVNKD